MPSILLVDDEESIRNVYSKLLAVEGFQVKTAASGEEAFSQVFDDKPDIILLDVTLPRMSGIEFLTRIKSDHTVGSIPILMLSGSSEMKTISECLHNGAAGYIIKGENHKELLNRINLLIRLRTKS